MKIISTLLIFVPVFIFCQAKYTPVSYQNKSTSIFSSLKYIDNGKAAFIRDGEVYEMNIDENYYFDIKYVQNSGINQNVISRYDVNKDGVKDLLTYDNEGKGLFTFISTPERFIPVSQLSTKKITSFTAQDFDDDGIDEIFINGDLFKYNPDGSLSLMIKGPYAEYTYKSPYFIDIDQDGDKDVLVNIVTNIGYLENVDNKKFNLKIISKYNDSCYGLYVIETTDGPKIVYYNARKKTINRIIPDSGSYTTKIVVSDLFDYGFETFVSDVTGDGNQEILFRTKHLDRLYTFQYNIALDTGKIIYQEFEGSKGMFIIDDRGKNKIVGFKSNGMNVYEYDENMSFNLIASNVNNLSLNDNSFIDIDGDKFVDMVNTSYQRRYFGKDDFDVVKNLSLPDTGGKLFDFDDDGDADYVKEEIWYENLADGVFSSAKPNPEFNPYPDPEIYFTKVIFKKDLDDDGDIDLLSYNSFGESLLLHENINNEYFKEGVELANNSIISGKLRSIKYLDLDGDGKKDILMAAASSLVWFKQESSLQFSNGIVLYNDLTVRSIDVKDGDFDGIPDIVLGTGKIITATAKGQTILFKGTSSGPVLKGHIENNKGYKYPKFINSDGVGALDVIVESKDQLYIYRLSSYENLNPKLQNITNEYHNYKSFKIMDVDGDLDEDIIMYKNGGTGVSYLLKDESIPLGECPTGNITLRNKNQVNHFKTNFGHCTVIDGNLTLGNGVDWADINDLEAFKNIVEIKGYLYIDELNKIKNYLGFRNLERIGGSLIIKGLKHGNLLGFEKLKSIGGDIRFYNAFTVGNDAGDFSAFESFDSLGGSIILKYSSFSNIDDLFVDNVINGDLILDGCTSLKAINGLYNVDSIKGNILIRDCSSITDLNSLSNLIYFEGLNLVTLRSCSKLSLNLKMDTIKNDLSISHLHPELTFQQNNHIKYVMGSFSVAVPTIGSWHSLEYIGGTFGIMAENVDSLSFNKLTHVGGGFLFNVEQSSDFSNFKNLKKIGKYFSPVDYSKSLSGFEKLDTIGGSCTFYKSELTDISAFKDNIFIGGKWSIVDNPLLSICDVPALCNHIKAGREYDIRYNAEGCNDISDIKCLDHSISGTVFYDYNENGIIDSTDASLSNVKINFNNGNNSIITSNNGFYQKSLLEGNSFSVSTEGLEGWHFTTDKEYVIDSFIPFVTEVENLNFGLKPDVDKKEIFTSVTSGFFICNREFYVDIFTKNMGTEKSSGFLKVTYSDKIRLHPDFTDFTSHYIDKREIFLEYNDLYPYSNIKSKLLFIAPGAEELENDSLIIKVEVYENNQNQQPIKVHEDFLKLHLQCFHDSNDKIVSSTDKTGNLRINEDDELIYTIRFQNTGDSYAENIRIVDELPENLDIASFEFINASHNVEIILKNRKLTFLFDNIFLPDSTSSFTESQGYVTFKIKSLSNELNISFLNEANVFYDYNQAVTTNEVNSIIYDPSVRLNEVKLEDIEIYPLPAMGTIYFKMKRGHSDYNFIIFNQFGQQVKANQMNNSGSINIADLSSGIYYIIVFDNENKKILKKRIIITK